MRRLIVPALFLIILSCSKSVNFITSSVDLDENRVKLNYQLYENSKNAKLALVIPDLFDSLSFPEQSWVQSLKKEGYSIIIPSKVGNSSFDKRTFDSKNARLNDLKDLLDKYIHSSENTKSLNLIIGLGEGGYLAPALSKGYPNSKIVCINAGARSSLYEMEYMALNEKPFKFEKYLEQNGIRSFDKFLSLEYKALKTKNLDNVLLRPTNSYWQSYYFSESYLDLYNNQNEALYINYEDFPLMSSNAQNDGKSLLAARVPLVKWTTLKGDGNFNKEKASLQLDSLLRVFY